MQEGLQSAVQDFLVMLVTGILGLLCASLIALAKKGFDWLNAKINSINSSVAREDLKEAMGILENSVYNTVTALQESLGDHIKESLRLNDGSYTYDDLLGLKSIALNTIKSQLNDLTVELITEAYGDLDTLVNNMIETQVRCLKNSTYQLTEGAAVDEEL